MAASQQFQSRGFSALTGEQAGTLLGRDDQGRRHCLTVATWEAWDQLAERAAGHGFDLAIASGWRGFDRQLAIWNAKAAGERLLLDSAGQALSIDDLSPRERVYAILRWSALPGASRHHWGTDLDVYDRAALPAGYQLQLTVDEAEGLFAPMHDWLGACIDANASCGFTRPYRFDTGGVAPEPWHLSYSPEAQIFEAMLDKQALYNFLASRPLALKETVLAEFDEIYRRYVQPAQQ